MADKERIQLNLRLDGRRELLDAVKAVAEAQDISINEFVIRSLKATTKKPELIHLQPEPLAVLLDTALENRVTAIEERLGKIEGLSETPAPEPLKPDTEEIAELLKTKNLYNEAMIEEVRGRNSREAYDLRQQQQVSDLKHELEDANATILVQRNKIRELERGHSFKPSPVESSLRLEIGDLRAELETYKQQQPANASELPSAADLLNQLLGKRKKSTANLADVEKILELLEGRT